MLSKANNMLKWSYLQFPRIHNSKFQINSKTYVKFLTSIAFGGPIGTYARRSLFAYQPKKTGCAWYHGRASITCMTCHWFLKYMICSIHICIYSRHNPSGLRPDRRGQQVNLKIHVLHRCAFIAVFLHLWKTQSTRFLHLGEKMGFCLSPLYLFPQKAWLFPRFHLLAFQRYRCHCPESLCELR